MRYTKCEVKGMFNRLVASIERIEGVGSCKRMTLDYVACYGGYVIQELGPDIGCSHRFGCFRRNAREMYLSMWMTCQALEDIAYKNIK
jgi:hypothetical protein